MNNGEEVLQEENIQDKEENQVLDTQEDKEKEDILENLQNDTELQTVEVSTHTILVDGKEMDWYIEMYREAKVTNFLLQFILVLIPTLWALTKIYSAVRSMLTVKF